MRAEPLRQLFRVRALRASRFLLGSPSFELPSGIALGALIFVVTELIAVAIAVTVDPFLGLGIVVAPAFAALCFLSMPAAWLLVLAAVPFSHELYMRPIGAALWLPTEPMIFLFLLIWGFRSLLRGDHRIPRSSILTWTGLLGLTAVLSAIQSQYPILSIKAVLSVSWYVIFAFLFPYLNGRDGVLIRRGIYLLAATALLFSVYGLVFITRNGLARVTANLMGWPFFREHGTYSAYVSFGLAALLALGLTARETAKRAGGLVAASAVALAVLLSLARAAYLGLVGVFGIIAWHTVSARRATTVLGLVVVMGAAWFGLHRFQAGEFVGVYTQTIAQPGELSNLERISRWLAAYNMLQARPVLGVGYGAYPDSYFSYRVLTLKTGEEFKRMGVHSEYFKVLAEMGWLGGIALAGFLIAVFVSGGRAIRHARSQAERGLALAALAGLASYLVHGFFNNYSGTDKLGIPFWFSIAAIAVFHARARKPVDAA